MKQKEKNSSKGWEEKLKEQFGAFAILGKLGRVYNGAVKPDTRLSDLEAFISTLLQQAVESEARKYCHFIGFETVDNEKWCETHDKFEALTPKKRSGK